MKKVRAVLKLPFLVAAVLCCLLIGCVTQQQYRTDRKPAAYDPTSTNVSRAMVEVSSNYSIGYVEFDDQGWLYGAPPRQPSEIDTVLNWIKAEGDTNGLLIVVFVHGWKNNAAGNDTNVVSFHAVLDELGAIEREANHRRGAHKARRVVGLYVGWRGLSSDLEPFKELSFWNRKDAAEVVGHGAVIELLSRLEDLRNQINRQYASDVESGGRARSKLLILGHSFGGDVVYSATAPVLIDRMAQNVDTNGVRQAPKTLGDLVVLLNPAFEAARFQPLQNLAATKAQAPDTNYWFPPGTNCTLAIFTSTADWATGLAFPIGRSLSTALTTYVNKRQARENITAVGHFEPLITHTLKIRDPNAAVTKDTLTSGVINNSARTSAFMTNAGPYTNQLVFDFLRCRLAPTPHCVPNDPVFNVAVDPALIPDHDTIFQANFVHFLVQFLFEFSASGEK